MLLRKLPDGLHNIEESQPFLGQTILDTWWYFSESLALDKPAHFQHLEAL